MAKRTTGHRTTTGNRRRTLFKLLLITFAGLIGLGLAEVCLALFAPQETLSPRYMFSPEYGVRPFPAVTMVHAQRGRYRFNYTTNRRGHRGQDVPISNRYKATHVVILGDSRSFGMGADDGEEYPTLLQQHVGNNLQVVNLGCPSWGLTQQIRCYYELGQLYRPSVVILQTNGNDVRDNIMNRVTEVRDGRFVFQDSSNSVNSIKRYLSRSWIQKTNLYNLVRNDLYQWFSRRAVGLPQTAQSTSETPLDAQEFYNELLTAFAHDLRQADVRLVVFSHERDFRNSPTVKQKIDELNAAGLLIPCPLDPWLEGEQDFGSPEGHLLGNKGHALAAAGLAKFLRDRFPDINNSDTESNR